MRIVLLVQPDPRQIHLGSHFGPSQEHLAGFKDFSEHS